MHQIVLDRCYQETPSYSIASCPTPVLVYV